MKFLMQFMILLLFCAIEELLKELLPFPVPASVYGLLLLLLCLWKGIVKIEQVKQAALFLIAIMPVMFIPAGVALTQSWDSLQPILLPAVVIIVVTTILVMAVTGMVSQKMMTGETKEHE